ncbi:MAG: HAD family hydrolase [Clostridiales bacterium]|nr:HAD family hydrolase [Clostridiales bacterium]
MKTLYVTDLDGTLLTKDQVVSEYSKRVINELVDNGMLFTYATARSLETASMVAKGINVSAPRVLYNGAFVRDTDGRLLLSHTFENQGKNIVNDLIAAGVYPIVYALIDGQEKFSFIPEKQSRAAAEFNKTREACVRYNPVSSVQELLRGDIFYITCIDDAQKLAPLYDKYKNDYSCVYSSDIYSGDQWLEIIPKKATKANALLELKQMLNCRLVVFGDGKNDIDMFKVADECYAVENAVNELKDIATSIIPNNNCDGVAKQLIKLVTNK